MKPTLTKLSASNGKITAVHSWATGYQVLTFGSLADFASAKKAMEG